MVVMLMLEVDTDSADFSEENESPPKKLSNSSDSDTVPLSQIKNQKKIVLRIRRKRDISSDNDVTEPLPKKRKKAAIKSKVPSKTKFETSDGNKDADNPEVSGKRTKKNIFTCDSCAKTFTTKFNLTKHIKYNRHIHRCQHCPSYFLKPKNLARHLKVKHANTAATHKCTLCSAAFKEAEELQIHQITIHEIGNTEYSCLICGKVFASKEGCEYHEQYSHSEDKIKKKKPGDSEVRIFTCKMCSKTFESNAVLRTHLKTHHVSKNLEYRTGSWQCCICPRSFTSSDGLKYHLATHTGERRYACAQCKRRFIKKSHLLEHIATHVGDKCYKCERCPRTFTTMSTLKKHLKIFPGKHSFPCDKCRKVFTKESKLEKHYCVELESITLDPEVTAQLSEDMIEQYLCMTEEADKEAGLKSCYKCFKVFPNMAALQLHQNEHVGRQTYQCRFCPETFLRADAFSSHIKNHLGSTPYMCLQCNRKFISPFTLASHAKSFPGDHSFTCTKCKRWFPSPEYLLKHECILQNCDTFRCACGKEIKDWHELVEHVGGKPYKCCVCDQKYIALTQLTRHIKNHTGFKPFACTKCDRTFLSRVNWSTHQRSHELDLLKCGICNYKNISRKRFSGHMSKKHNIQGPTGSDSTLCPVCGVIFNSLPQMKKHIEQEHGNDVAIENYDGGKRKKTLPQELCTLCGKMLTNKYSLASHLKKVHDPSFKESKKLKCEVCNELFPTKSRLRKHQDVHDTPGPRPCTICQMECNSAKELRAHERKHDELRPYSCGRCGKLFKVAVSLKYHGNICGVEKKRPHQVEEEPVYQEGVETGAWYHIYEQGRI